MKHLTVWSLNHTPFKIIESVNLNAQDEVKDAFDSLKSASSINDLFDMFWIEI